MNTEGYNIDVVLDYNGDVYSKSQVDLIVDELTELIEENTQCDSGLASRVSYLENNVSSIESDISGIETNYETVSSNITELQTSVTSLGDAYTTLSHAVGNNASNITVLQSNFGYISEQTGDIYCDVKRLEMDYANIHSTVCDVAYNHFLWLKGSSGTGSAMMHPENVSTGNYSNAEGYQTQATANYAHAEGIGSKATGANGSHAEGYQTTASGQCSHSEGFQTTASNQCSHAEGYKTQATAVASHAEGWQTIAAGQYSFAHGRESSTTSNANGSFAIGRKCIGADQYTHASGGYAYAYGWGAQAHGYHVTTSNTLETVFGAWNETTYIDRGEQANILGNANAVLFGIGCGTGEQNKKNGFEMRGNGDIYIRINDTLTKLQEMLVSLDARITALENNSGSMRASDEFTFIPT